MLRAGCEVNSMQVEMRPIGSIKPYEDNPRLNDAGVEAVAASIKAFGFRQPIVVDEEDVIIVGHTRYKAALKLGMTEVPVHVARGLTPAQARAYRIADNQTATLSQWDEDKLPLELMALQREDFDLIADRLPRGRTPPPPTQPAGEGQCDPDEVPEPPDRTDHRARRPVGAGPAPAPVRRCDQARGPGPAPRRLPGGHAPDRPAVQRGLRGEDRRAAHHRQRHDGSRRVPPLPPSALGAATQHLKPGGSVLPLARRHRGARCPAGLRRRRAGRAAVPGVGEVR